MSQPLDSPRQIVPPTLILLVILLLGSGLRLYHLGYRSFWIDEAVVYHVSRGSPAEVIEQAATIYDAPPLSPLLLNVASTGDDSEFSLRLISAFAGILSIAVAFRLFSAFLPPPYCYLWTLLVAIAPMHIFHAQDVREYTLVFLLACLSYWLFWRFLHGAGTRTLMLLGVVLVVCIFTQYGLGLMILALNIIAGIELLAGRLSRVQLKGWVTVQIGLLVAVGVVYVATLSEQIIKDSPASEGFLRLWVWDGSLRSLLLLMTLSNYMLILYAFPGYEFSYLPPALGDAFIFSSLALAGVVYLLRTARTEVRRLMLVAVPPLVTFVMALLPLYPYSGTRHTMFLHPLVFLTTGFGLVYLQHLTQGRPYRRALLHVAVLGLFGLGFYYSYQAAPHPRAGRYASDCGSSGC